jgi:Mlc titration factor MtfA (ptsG expression regulator)
MGNIVTTLLIVLIAGIPILFLSRYLLAKKQRMKLIHTPLKPELEKILRENVPPYRRLSEKMREELQGLVNIFLYEKEFEGCGGLEITDEIRITIAGEACLLLLNRNLTDCFPDLQTILVYPTAYVAKGAEIIGGKRVENSITARAGESWQNGAVVLAWDHIRHGVHNCSDGHNVVLHEFGHQLDQETGTANGAPPLKTYHTWAQVMGHNFEELCEKVEENRKDVIDSYGATNPAEFFAVTTETFFEKPEKLKQEHPKLFQQLLKYYKVNPINWK